MRVEFFEWKLLLKHLILNLKYFQVSFKNQNIELNKD